MIDETHDPARTSWVASANGHADFPIQNLPFGIFSPPQGSPRGGVAIGDAIFDIGAALHSGLFRGLAREAAEAASGRTLNPLLEAGAPARRALRRRVSALLDAGGADRDAAMAAGVLHEAAACTLHLPARVGDYTDFFAGISHAMNAGKLNRPDNPLMPNYKYVPVAYHSRASSVRVSGGKIRRPNGQRKPSGQDAPDFGPCRNLDYELELGIWIGEGNRLGEPIPMRDAASPYRRLLPAERLVRARHPGLGVGPARPVPGEELLHLGLALDRHGRGHRPVPQAAASPPAGRSQALAASMG